MSASSGTFVRLGRNEPGDPYWAEVYDGRFGHVLFGHDARPNEPAPVRYPHATGLDLGCVYGGALAAVVLEGDREVATVTIPARKRYGHWRG